MTYRLGRLSCLRMDLFIVGPVYGKSLCALSAFIVIVSVHGTSPSFVMGRLASADERDEDLKK